MRDSDYASPLGREPEASGDQKLYSAPTPGGGGWLRRRAGKNKRGDAQQTQPAAEADHELFWEGGEDHGGPFAEFYFDRATEILYAIANETEVFRPLALNFYF